MVALTFFLGDAFNNVIVALAAASVVAMVVVWAARAVVVVVAVVATDADADISLTIKVAVWLASKDFRLFERIFIASLMNVFQLREHALTVIGCHAYERNAVFVPIRSKSTVRLQASAAFR